MKLYNEEEGEDLKERVWAAHPLEDALRQEAGALLLLLLLLLLLPPLSRALNSG